MDKTLNVIVTDTHFGVYQNSTTWLETQMRVFYEQIIPLADKNRAVHKRLIHCGDLFDSRSSLNTVVLKTVRALFDDLCDNFNEVIIIGGNHDYYSPVDGEQNVCSISFLNERENLIRITKKPEKIGNNLFVPWFPFNDYEYLARTLGAARPTNIFCHTDWAAFDLNYSALLTTTNVISGHIHTPHIDGNIYNLGSLYSLTFTDANQERGYYTMEDDDISTLRFHENKSTIRFWKFFDDEIFDDLSVRIREHDKVAIYITDTNLVLDSYRSRIDELSTEYGATAIVRPSVRIVDEGMVLENKGVEELCDSMIPEHLQEVYKKIKSMLQ